MNQCPKCRAYMRWYMPQHGSPFTTVGSWHCDNCGYDTANVKCKTTDRTDEDGCDWCKENALMLDNYCKDCGKDLSPFYPKT